MIIAKDTQKLFDLRENVDKMEEKWNKVIKKYSKLCLKWDKKEDKAKEHNKYFDTQKADEECNIANEEKRLIEEKLQKADDKLEEYSRWYKGKMGYKVH